MIQELEFIKNFLRSTLLGGKNIFLEPVDRERLNQIDEKKAISTQYHPDLVPKGLDVIIVGGGIGGLVCASFLSRAGKKVLVLEKDKVAGGCTKVFRFPDHPDYEMPIGCHYIAGAVDNTIYDAVFQEASIKSLELVDMPPYFDKVMFADEKTEFLVGTKGRFKADLVKRFPDEKEAIERFVDLCYTFLGERDQLAVLRIMPGLLKKIGKLFIAPNYMKYKDMTYQAYLDSNFKSSLLKGILSYMCSPLGIKPDEAPLPIVAVCFAVFLDGTAYPQKGPGMFGEKIARANEYFGGKVLCNAEVAEILVDENDKAFGVALFDGTRLTAETIISDCGYIKTFRQFLPKRFHYVVKQFEPGCQHFLIFLGFKAGQEVLKFPDHNMYLAKNAAHFNNKDFLRQNTIDEKVELPSIFINFPTVFHNQNGKSIVVMAVEARYDWFKQWKDNKDEAYRALGDALMNRCLERFFSLFPDSKAHLDFAKWATPLDMEKWIGSPSGSSFTTKLNFNRILDQTQITPIKNLYMTGADAFLANGITVGAISALVAAQIVSKKNLMKMVMETENSGA